MFQVQGPEAADQAQAQPPPDLQVQGVRGTGRCHHFESVRH